jgi:hypothetical protein
VNQKVTEPSGMSAVCACHLQVMPVPEHLLRPVLLLLRHLLKVLLIRQLQNGPP